MVLTKNGENDDKVGRDGISQIIKPNTESLLSITVLHDMGPLRGLGGVSLADLSALGKFLKFEHLPSPDTSPQPLCAPPFLLRYPPPTFNVNDYVPR